MTLNDRVEELLREAAEIPELPDKPLLDGDALDLVTRPGPAVPDAVTRSALRWLVDLLALPPGTAGAVVRDAGTATLAALAAARHRVLTEVGWDVEGQGLSAAPPVTVVVGDDAHPKLRTALRLLGLGQDRVVRVRTDGQGRMRPTLIPPLHPPAIVCAQVGEAASGAVDPVAAICAEVHDADAWVHVDGTFGLWAAASPLTRDLLIGVSYADSWAAAALEVPYDSGLVFARDADALWVALELARPARGVEVWAALLALGRIGVADLVEGACGQARRLARELTAAGYPVLNEVVLDRVVVGFGSAERAADAVARVRAVGVSVGGTRWHGRPAMCLRVGIRRCTDEQLATIVRLVCAGE